MYILHENVFDWMNLIVFDVIQSTQFNRHRLCKFIKMFNVIINIIPVQNIYSDGQTNVKIVI